MVMQKHYDITRQRIDRFLPAGYWGDQNLSHQYYTHRALNSPWVILEKYSVPDLKRIPFHEAVKGRFLSSHRNVSIGPTWSTHWFKVYIRIPSDWDGLFVGINWVFHGESLVYTREGEPIYSMSADGGRDLFHLTDSCTPNQTFFFYIECACNQLNGISGIGPPNPNNYYEIQQADLLVIDRNVYKLHHNFEILRQLSNDIPRDSNRADKAMFAANKIMNVWDKFNYNTIFECIKISEDFLKLKNGQGQMELTCIGNCHIDTAWLWPYAETRRKICRSWVAQLAHMDTYPDYHFTASQAQQFEWLLDNYPSTFDKLKQRVKDGRFHPVGGTWVEMDTNVPSGESLCKQFLYGQRFFNRHLKFKSEVFWLPDTFGYAAQLPQIVRKCGMKYFFTQKLSWNNINQFPHTTFHWEALDGSKILSHMAPSNTYVAQVHVLDLRRSVENHKDRPYSNQALLLFGFGDGGGGPSPDMLERYDRLKDIDGLPKLKMTGPDEFYHGLDKDGDKLVTWKGELYFELHRGTYTNHGDVKRGNRLSEVLLHNLEVASSYAYYAMNNSYRVPQTELNRMWKMTLCNQFHDVLPGTCIELAYQEVFEYYNEIDQLGNRLLDDALRNIFYSNTKVNPETETLTDLGVLNTLSWTRNEIIKVPLNKFKRGQDLNFDQISHDGKVGYKAAVDLKPFTPTVLKLTDHPQLDEKMSEKKALYGEESVSVSVDSVTNIFFLENSFIKAKFSDRGQLISLYDKRVNRELIPKGSVAHQLQLFEDIPLDWDAWDVEVYHLEKFKNFTDATVNILEMGPVVASLEIKYNLTLGSSAVIIVSLSSLSPRLDFHAKVDWRENRRFLKVEFTFDIRNDHAHYETQWGNIKRPNHYNTSWDMAKFEVCGHRFCDLSEYGYGVAIVNDLKYGYACLDNKIRLSLLRSSKGPDGNSDMKVHEFQYGIYPHPNRFLASDAMQIAHEFSTPSVYLPISHQPNFSRSPLFQLRGDANVFLETIKRSEDFDENLIVRLYEAYGGHARVRLMSPLPVSSIKEVSILEEEITTEEMGATYSDDDLEWEAQGFVQLEFKPFEIKTLRLSMRLNKLKNPTLTEKLTSCFENICL